MVLSDGDVLRILSEGGIPQPFTLLCLAYAHKYDDMGMFNQVYPEKDYAVFVWSRPGVMIDCMIQQDGTVLWRGFKAAADMSISTHVIEGDRYKDVITAFFEGVPNVEAV